MEKAYKEELFLMLSMLMDKDEARKKTEEVFSRMKEIYSNVSERPIKGNDVYRITIKYPNSDEELSYYLIEKLNRESDSWFEFIKSHSKDMAMSTVRRLEAGGNSVVGWR